MEDIPLILQNLANNPQLFRVLLEGIPEHRRQERRQGGQWTIHEWTAHLASAQDMLTERFQHLLARSGTIIIAHLPDFSQPNETLLAMDLEDCLVDFSEKRAKMLTLLGTFTEADWQAPGTHEEYEIFNAYILLRHVLLVDNVHFFNIEKLWLTRDNYLI